MTTVTYQHFATGRERTEAAIPEAARLAADGARDLRVIELASEIVRLVPEKKQAQELAALFRWYKRKIRYYYHPFGVQLIQAAPYTLLERRGGDCAATVTALAALGMSIGLPAAIKAVAANPAEPTEYSHVYPVFYIRRQRRWVAADPVGGAYVGWEPPARRVFFSGVWPIPID